MNQNRGILEFISNIAGPVAGTALDFGLNLLGHKKTGDMNYEYASKLQQKDMDFQKEMRETAYQTMVDDMIKAGLNPAQAIGGGGTVMGGSSNASASTAGNFNTNFATNALGLTQGIANIKQTYANIDNQTAATAADIELKKAQATKELKEAGFTEKQIEYYMKHGVFPGATETTTYNATAFGIGGGKTKTTPIGLKTTGGRDKNRKTAKKIADWIDDRLDTFKL